MRKVLILTMFIFFLTFNLFGENKDKQYVENLIKSTTDKVLKILKDKKLPEKLKKDKIFEIVNPLFDFKIMSKLTLGKKYWMQMNADQRKKFISLFEKRIRMVYLDRVTLANVEVKFKPSIQKKKRIIFVPTIFSSNGKNYSVLFKLYKSKSGWKVYDVEVEGVSIIRTYRSQFQGILSKGTIEDLFKKLENMKENEKAL